MPRKRELIIEIDADGTVAMDADGFEGKGCHEVLESLQRELGRVKNSKRKPEYYKAKASARDRLRR